MRGWRIAGFILAGILAVVGFAVVVLGPTLLPGMLR